MSKHRRSIFHNTVLVSIEDAPAVVRSVALVPGDDTYGDDYVLCVEIYDTASTAVAAWEMAGGEPLDSRRPRGADRPMAKP